VYLFSEFFYISFWLLTESAILSALSKKKREKKYKGLQLVAYKRNCNEYT